MDKIIRTAALISNSLFVISFLFIWQEVRPYRLEEYLLLLVVFISPVLALLALRSGPDTEERRLQRAVRKAELRHRLKELDESN
jgi:hypothetical protein